MGIIRGKRAIIPNGIPWSSLDGFTGCRGLNILKPMIVSRDTCKRDTVAFFESQVTHGSPDIRRLLLKIKENLFFCFYTFILCIHCIKIF